MDSSVNIESGQEQLAKKSDSLIEEGSGCEFCGCFDTCMTDSAREGVQKADTEPGTATPQVKSVQQFTVRKPVPPSQVEIMVTSIFILAAGFAVLLGVEMYRSAVGFNSRNPLFFSWLMWMGVGGFFALVNYEPEETSTPASSPAPAADPENTSTPSEK